MKCRKCGRDFVDTAKFCPYCGTKAGAAVSGGVPKIKREDAWRTAFLIYAVLGLFLLFRFPFPSFYFQQGFFMTLSKAVEIIGSIGMIAILALIGTAKDKEKCKLLFWGFSGIALIHLVNGVMRLFAFIIEGFYYHMLTFTGVLGSVISFMVMAVSLVAMVGLAYILLFIGGIELKLSDLSNISSCMKKSPNQNMNYGNQNYGNQNYESFNVGMNGAASYEKAAGNFSGETEQSVAGFSVNEQNQAPEMNESAMDSAVHTESDVNEKQQSCDAGNQSFSQNINYNESSQNFAQENSNANCNHAGQNYNAGYNNQNAGGYTQNMGAAPLKTDRGLFGYILLSIITCGIYRFYFIYSIARDINTSCEGDGKSTGGLIQFILLSLLTCGIYAYWWEYSIGNRLASNAPRYGMSFHENGTSILLWELFGIMLCGIGPFIAMNIIIKNTNSICMAYNRKHGFMC